MILKISSVKKLTIMKKLLILIILTVICISCEKNEFDPNNPNVEKFVNQIKNGTYNCYKKGEKGEDLWLLMPVFTEYHIQSLIELSKDTTHIVIFPTNPFSSRRALPGGREYFILGECLLWTIEGIRNGTTYGSLDPFLIDTSLNASERIKGLKSKEILHVRDIYEEWWKDFKDKDWKNKNPLAETSYRWY